MPYSIVQNDITKIHTDIILEINEYINTKLKQEETPFDEVTHDTIFFDADKESFEELSSELLKKIEPSFSEYLFQLIDSKKMSNCEVYKKANIDRKLFSKLKKPQYRPSKPTAVALAIALELDLEMTKKLVEKAGFSITYSNKFDIIIEYFIIHKIYDIIEINEALFAFDQPLLGNGKYDG